MRELTITTFILANTAAFIMHPGLYATAFTYGWVAITVLGLAYLLNPINGALSLPRLREHKEFRKVYDQYKDEPVEVVLSEINSLTVIRSEMATKSPEYRALYTILKTKHGYGA